MEKKRIARRMFPRYAGVFLLAAVVMIAGVGIKHIGYTQDDCIRPYLELLAEIPDLDQLSAVMKDLNDHPEKRKEFMEDPRSYLERAGVKLPEEIYQITAVDFDVGFEKGVFRAAEPRGELKGTPEGIGIFYPRVGLFIQEAGDGISRPPVVESYLRLLARLPEQNLCSLSETMRDLNGIDLPEPGEENDRTEFLANPREFLLNKGIKMPSDFYRLVALDFEQAQEKAPKAFALAPLPPDHTAEREGLGVFYSHVGVFIQIVL